MALRPNMSLNLPYSGCIEQTPNVYEVASQPTPRRLPSSDAICGAAAKINVVSACEIDSPGDKIVSLGHGNTNPIWNGTYQVKEWP